MIAKKREVATSLVGFSVERMSRGRRSAISAGKPDGKSLYSNIVSAREQINVWVRPPEGGIYHEPA